MTDEQLTLRFHGCMATNIEQVYRHLEHLYEELIHPLGINMLEWYALRALYEQDGLTASHLAALVCRHPSSMTALLDRMERKGLLRREVDSDDRRSVRIYLTDAGRALQPRVESIAGQLEHLINEALTPEQMDTFLYVLGVLQRIDVTEPGA